MIKRTYRLLCVLAGTVLLVTGALTGCSGSGKSGVSKGDGIQQTEEAGAEEKHAPKIDGLEYKKTMKLKYATGFDVYYYKEGYKLLDVHEDRQYLMEDGKILFAGKYSEPDYEMLIDEDCDLAIESTMILHTPKVQEMIEDLDIPVFIDRSSYESHPLGRTEWIKAYAAMLNKEDAADTFFDTQTEVIGNLKDFKNTGKTVAYFFVNTDGTVVVRSSSDYIPKMIDIAGGKYIFQDLKNTKSKSASVELSMEEFYAKAKNADYLIYNASIDSPINSIADLTAKSELFADFKAVKNGNVWCTGKSLYQATDIVGNLITDINLMLTDGDESGMTFLYRVK